MNTSDGGPWDEAWDMASPQLAIKAAETLNKKNGAASMAKQQTTKPEVPTHQEDPILSAAAAGKLVGKSGPTIISWIRDGLLNAVRFPGAGGRFGVRKSEALKLISNSALADKVIQDGH